MPERPIIIATRGSALALAQSNLIANQCRAAFPRLQFELKIIKTTGDKLQKASMSQPASLPKGLFTKELEVAILKGQADFAVHSLKDLPTELPTGLKLSATPQREDVRDVLIFRDQTFFTSANASRGLAPHATLKDFPKSATIATSSTRRKAQLQAARPDFQVVEIRGNVGTRMKKIAEQSELDGTVLALAGITRLHFTIESDGKLKGDGVPEGLLATILDVDLMLPCVGQAAIGIESRIDDVRIDKLCARLNDLKTFQAVTAERAFLAAMGGGCMSPVAAYATVKDDSISMRAISFRDGPAKTAKGKAAAHQAAKLGERLAAKLK